MNYRHAILAVAAVIVAGTLVTGCAQEVPQAGEGDNAEVTEKPEPVTLPPGEYTLRYADGSGNTDKATFAALCPSMTRVTLWPYDANIAFLEGSFTAGIYYPRYYRDIIQNNGMQTGPSELDREGECRFRIAFSGAAGGNSVHFDKFCRVRTVVVEADRSVAVKMVDADNCIDA
ncbi:MAG TPA: hypothetical protein VI168_06875 [Croceibacterium sp.]